VPLQTRTETQDRKLVLPRISDKVKLCGLRTGPVLSRFDRFLPIGPRAKRGPGLRLLNNANLHFLSKLHVYRIVPAPDAMFFKAF